MSNPNMNTTQKIIFTPAAQQDTTANTKPFDPITSPGNAFYDMPAKPADAHAAGAHTPKSFYNSSLYDACVAGSESAAREVAKLITETAAERDRLRSERDELAARCEDWSLKFSDKCKAVEKWSQGYSNIHAQLENTERERDQAREQVKTLLKACKRIEKMPWPDSESPYALIARAAIASVESEEAE